MEEGVNDYFFAHKTAVLNPGVRVQKIVVHLVYFRLVESPGHGKWNTNLPGNCVQLHGCYLSKAIQILVESVLLVLNFQSASKKMGRK